MKTAIFDLDGTIADTIYDLADAVNFGLRRMNCRNILSNNIKISLETAFSSFVTVLFLMTKNLNQKSSAPFFPNTTTGTILTRLSFIPELRIL